MTEPMQTQQARNAVADPTVPHSVVPLFDAACRAVSDRRRDILSVLRNRVSWQATQHWRKGRRRVPQWALDAMLAAVERKSGPLDHVRQLARDMRQQSR